MTEFFMAPKAISDKVIKKRDIYTGINVLLPPLLTSIL
jgi:hypothetical protein